MSAAKPEPEPKVKGPSFPPFDVYYPHILDMIIHATSHNARLALRAASKRTRDRVDALYFPRHVVINFSVETEQLTLAAPPLATDAARRTYFHAAQKFRKANELEETPLMHTLRTSPEVGHVLSMARIIDIDVDADGALELYEGWWDEFRDLVPHLHTVRYHWQMHYTEPLFPVPLVVFFLNVEEHFHDNSHLFNILPSAVDKIVINIEGKDVDDLPNFGPLDEWALRFCNETLDTPDDWYDNHDNTPPPPGWSSPQHIVFCLSYTGEKADPDDAFAFMMHLARYLVLHLLKHMPWVTPTFVVHPEPMLDADTMCLTELAGEMWQLKDDIRTVIRELEDLPLKQDTMPGYTSPVWSDDDVEEMIGRLEVITCDEYLERVGPDVFALETSK